MACPLCDHTMKLVAPRLWWCPRCGTIKDAEGAGRHESPVRGVMAQADEVLDLLVPRGVDNAAGSACWACLGTGRER